MSTTAQLSENSHQGFEGLKAALCLASMQVKSNPASGMPVCLRRNGIGSRSSSKERDAETGLDFFLARCYSGAQGRFLSIDPENAGAMNEDPQSWNAYSYALNNPLRYIDPDGLSSDCYLDGISMPCENTNTWVRNGAGVVTSESRYQWDNDAKSYKGLSIDALGNTSYNFIGALPKGEVSIELGSIVPAVVSYKGFWGILKWLWTGGIEGDGQYSLSGKYIGPAPIMGMPPDVAIGGTGAIRFTAKMVSGSETMYEGYRIRKVLELVEKFGGKAKDWKKMKTLDEFGREVHFYYNKVVGRVGAKFAGQPDPF